MLSRNLPCHHRLAVHGEGRGEFWTGKALDDVENPSVVGGLPDRAAKIGSVKLPIDAWSGCNLGQQFLLSRIERFLRHSRNYLAGHFTGRLAPPAHEAKQKARRHIFIAARSVEGQETLPDHLRVDVPTGSGSFCSLDQLSPTGPEDIRFIVNVDLSRKYSFVSIFFI